MINFKSRKEQSKMRDYRLLMKIVQVSIASINRQNDGHQQNPAKPPANQGWFFFFMLWKRDLENPCCQHWN